MRVAVKLGPLQPNDVRVEFVAQRTLPEDPRELPLLASSRHVANPGDWTAQLRATGETEPDGAAVFALDAPAPGCGLFRAELRVHPWHELLTYPYEMGLMKRV